MSFFVSVLVGIGLAVLVLIALALTLQGTLRARAARRAGKTASYRAEPPDGTSNDRGDPAP